MIYCYIDRICLPIRPVQDPFSNCESGPRFVFKMKVKFSTGWMAVKMSAQAPLKHLDDVHPSFAFVMTQPAAGLEPILEDRIVIYKYMAIQN